MPLPDVVSGLLLSGRSEVQILLATPKTPPETLRYQGFRRFLFARGTSRAEMLAFLSGDARDTGIAGVQEKSNA